MLIKWDKMNADKLHRILQKLLHLVPYFDVTTAAMTININYDKYTNIAQ